MNKTIKSIIALAAVSTIGLVGLTGCGSSNATHEPGVTNTEKPKPSADFNNLREVINANKKDSNSIKGKIVKIKVTAVDKGEDEKDLSLEDSTAKMDEIMALTAVKDSSNVKVGDTVYFKIAGSDTLEDWDTTLLYGAIIK